MRQKLLLAILLLTFRGSAQCPFPATLNYTGSCLGNTLSVTTSNTISTIVWYNGTTIVNTATATMFASNGITVAGGNGGGSATNQFLTSYGLAVDGNGNIYVADVNNNRVQKWPPGATSGITVAGGMGQGANAYQLNNPMGIVVDGSDNLFIAENGNSRITEWVPGSTNGIPVAAGSSPTDVYVDGSGNIYVCESGTARVQKWTPGAGSGITVAGGNGTGPAANQFDDPEAVYVDAAGNIYVCDTHNNRIQKWVPGATSGITVAGGNGFGSAANQLAVPSDVFVDASGNVFIADNNNNRIQEWAPGATSGITVAGGNGFGGAANQLAFPCRIAFDSHGNLYVADVNNYRVQEFMRQVTPPATTYVPLTSGTYTALLTDNTGCPVITNAITIYPTVTPAIGITQSAATLCSSQPSFTATPVNGGSAPVYQWTVNGINAGTNSPTFTGNNLTPPAVVSCLLTSNVSCPTTPTAQSNGITVSLPPPITLKSKGNNCAGTDTLTISSTDQLMQINWYNGSAIVKTANAIAGPPAAAGITVAGGNGAGAAANQVYLPHAVWLDANGNIYVSDAMNFRVQRWAPGATSGVTVAGGNGSGTAPNQINGPTGMYVDGSGTIYIADFGNHQVEKFAPGSNNGVIVAGGNGQGDDPIQLNSPTGVFVDGSGNIFVADYGNNRIQEWMPGATTGVTVAGGNGPGDAANQLHQPGSVYVDGNGNVYVSDTYNHRVQKWAPGATSGVTVAGGNGQGGAANQLSYPSGLYVDRNGNVFIADQYNNRIQEWTPGATSGVTVAGGNGAGSAANQFNGVSSVYLDNSGNIYITDYNNNRVQKWGLQYTIDTTYIATTPGTYTVSATNIGECTATAGTVIINPLLPTAVSISASATAVCMGTPITFTAQPTNGGTVPDFQWQINGRNAGTGGPSFSGNAFANGDAITCVMTSHATCPSPGTITSNSIPLTINPSVTPSVSISQSTVVICAGNTASFNALPLNGGTTPTYQWMVNGMSTGSNDPVYSSNTLANGDVLTCTMTSNATCLSTPTATSAPFAVTVNAVGHPSINVTASPPSICAGDRVDFSAFVTDGGNDPVYQWQVNGASTGGNGPTYSSNNLSNGDVISCLYIANAGCASANSNSLSMMVNPLPQVTAGQTYSLSGGQSILLAPQVTGDISTYAWSPGTGLSDSTIADPVASPAKSTLYTLLVTTAEGCRASGQIKINVFTKLGIPNAFTPNGDGHNDVFYVLGGPEGSRIKDFAIYDRYGQKIFQVHDVMPADPAYGWDGYIGGKPAPTGTYVYMVVMSFADGSQHLLKGTVTLIR